MTKKEPWKFHIWLIANSEGQFSVAFKDGNGGGGGPLFSIDEDSYKLFVLLPEETREHLMRVMNRVLRADLEVVMKRNWELIDDDDEYKEFRFDDIFLGELHGLADELAYHMETLIERMCFHDHELKKKAGISEEDE